jgi:WD40 repeat protein
MQMPKIGYRNAERAEREKYLAAAKAMAIKSKELGNDLALEGLVAQQAYMFNKKYGGYEYNSDVYGGLYTALKNWEEPLTKSLQAHTNGAARALETHGKGNHIYSGGSDGRIIRWNYANKQWNAEMIVDKRLDYMVFTLDTSPDGNTLIAGGLFPSNPESNYAELYDLRNPSALRLRRYPALSITSRTSTSHQMVRASMHAITLVIA